MQVVVFMLHMRICDLFLPLLKLVTAVPSSMAGGPEGLNRKMAPLTLIAHLMPRFVEVPHAARRAQTSEHHAVGHVR